MLTLCAACTAPDPAPPLAPGESVSVQQQALLPFGCNGRVTELPPAHFTNLDLSVTPYFSSWQNTSPAELPHLVAPGVAISTVSDRDANTPSVRNCSGTSFSAPQVSGAIASIQEFQPQLKSWPEALMPIMLVSAFTNARPAGPDGQLFSLDDGVDDKDGVGLLNAFDAWIVATSKVNGGNVPVVIGYDYGVVDPSSWGQYTYYREVYSASVLPGDYLRVAVVMFNHPTCGSPATETNCTSDGFPLFDLNVTNPATGDSWWSIGYNNNYKYLRIHNTLATTQTLRIRMYMAGWNDLAWDTWGLAWSSDDLF